MQVIATILIIMALMVGIIPQFTDCLAQGKAITLPSGTSLPMKCHWSRQAEVAVSLPLAAVGLLMVFARHRVTLRALAVIGIALGAGAILIPTYLIGVCGSVEMICNMLMKPILIFAGVVTIATSVVALVYLRGEESAVLHAEREDPAP